MILVGVFMFLVDLLLAIIDRFDRLAWKVAI